MDENGGVPGDETVSMDPAGNITLKGAVEAIRSKLIRMLGDEYFRSCRRGD